MRETPAVILAFARERYVEGEVRNGYLLRVRSLVASGKLRQVQRRFRYTQAPTHGISRKRQDPGAKRWVQRADHAKLGFVGGGSKVWFPLNSRLQQCGG